MRGEDGLGKKSPAEELRSSEARRLVGIIENPRAPLDRRMEAVRALTLVGGQVAETALGNVAEGHGRPPRTLPAEVSFYAEKCVRWLREKKRKPTSREPPPKPDPYRLV